MELAEGKLIVISADDDVSLAARTEELVRVWLSGEVYYLHSNAIVIDEDGIMRETFTNVDPVSADSWQEVIRRPGFLGCTEAWDRAVFDVFGPLPEGKIYEDIVIPFRAALLGKIATVNKPLVKYRQHSGNTVLTTDVKVQTDTLRFAKYQTEFTRTFCESYEVLLRDTQLFLTTHPERKAELLEAKRIIEARIVADKFRVCAVESSRTDRLHSGLCTLRELKQLRQLTSTQVAKICLLTLSPLAYYGVQKFYYGIKMGYAGFLYRSGRFKGKFHKIFHSAR